MTDDNRKENIRAELERASETFSAALLLYENGFMSDAISRLYYFVLYHIRALLLTKGLEPRNLNSLYCYMSLTNYYFYLEPPPFRKVRNRRILKWSLNLENNP